MKRKISVPPFFDKVFQLKSELTLDPLMMPARMTPMFKCLSEAPMTSTSMLRARERITSEDRAQMWVRFGGDDRVKP
jgi:hypothetical protein